MQIVANTANELYARVLHHILREGDEVHPRGLETKEVIGASLVLKLPQYNVVTLEDRRLNYQFQVAEWLWIMLGRNDVATISAYNKSISKFSDDGRTFFGAYGPKFIEQLSYVLRTLEQDLSSRQAVMTFWRERPAGTKDTPCTLSLQFLCRDKRLSLVATMRSNDAWLGLPYDMFTFSQIQRYVAAVLGIGVGTYVHQAGSLHLYAPDFAKASQIALILAEGQVPELGVRSYDLSPMPSWLESYFLGLSDPRNRAGIMDSITGSWTKDDPIDKDTAWNNYLRVLAFRFNDNPWELPEPYRTLHQRRNFQDGL